MLKLTLDQARAFAKETWHGLFSIHEIETKPGAVVRNIENGMNKYYGTPLIQQFEVRLHSSTGPIHFIAITNNGTKIVK